MKTIKLSSLLAGKYSLLINSYSLMLSSGMAALFGFIFWIIVAHSYDSSTVGLATSLISVSTLLSLFGLAGFDTIFIRFLAKSKRRNEQINSGFIIAGLASSLIALFFCALIPLVSPKLGFVVHNLWFVAAFTVFTVFATWNNLTNAVLIAYRRASFIVIINIIFSLIKISLPLLVHSGGPMMIFTLVGIAQVVDVLLSAAILAKYFNYRPSLRIHFDLVREVAKFGAAVYVSNIFILLPGTVLPIIVLNRLGATTAAYFYIAFTIASVLYTIPTAVAQSLLAEVSNDEEQFKRHTRNGLKIAASIVVPSVVILLIFSPLILKLFGENYSQGASTALRILSISGLAMIFSSILIFMFKHTKNLKAILSMTIVNAAAVIITSILVIENYGLSGVGWSVLIGSCLSIGVGSLFVSQPRGIPFLNKLLHQSHS